MKGVSVVMCCFNSALRLPEALKYLASQKVSPDINWEVIVVNNASTDDTEAVAEHEWRAAGLPSVELRIVQEEKAGLSYARMKGVQSARFDYVIFCDDDNWLESDFINRVPQLFESMPQVGAIGGAGSVVTDIGLPAWFDTYKEYYAVGVQGERSGDVSSRKYLWGAGMCFRKSLFLEAYAAGPPVLTDRKNEALASGGDSEFCMRLLLMGYSLYYDDQLRFKHFMPGNRLTEQYREKLVSGIQASFPLLNLYSLMIDLNKLSFPKKGALLMESFMRYCIGKLQLVRRWNLSYQCRVIFHLTGIHLPDLDKESITIRNLYLLLRGKKNSVAI